MRLAKDFITKRRLELDQVYKYGTKQFEVEVSEARTEQLKSFRVEIRNFERETLSGLEKASVKVVFLVVVFWKKKL